MTGDALPNPESVSALRYLGLSLETSSRLAREAEEGDEYSDVWVRTAISLQKQACKAVVNQKADR